MFYIAPIVWGNYHGLFWMGVGIGRQVRFTAAFSVVFFFFLQVPWLFLLVLFRPDTLVPKFWHCPLHVVLRTTLFAFFQFVPGEMG